jgi:hypothetical protein
VRDEQRELLIHQLLALRSTVNAALSVVMSEERGVEEVCQHPKGRLENLTVMGGEEVYRCLDCGEELRPIKSDA